eukprot:TRINITY_DN70407_c0_g1_i1.p1 TRINITY_DN70407_c0_g1~~TRINITY_DN70407_c0_g1_i1.p1  ORF type:complete len:311 (-),score=60.07 TRINITY_DN70407_c0_g1_i1:574-1506(-)
MDGIHVAALRSICADYFETRVVPLIEDLHKAQAAFRAEVLDIVVSAKSELAPKGTTSCTIAQFDELSRRVDLTAKAADVPTLMQFESLAAQVEVQGSFGCTVSPLHAKLEALNVRLDGKANVEEVPTLAAFAELTKEVDRAAHSVLELSDRLDGKADVCNVSSLAQFERLQETVERKAKQQRILADSIELKADASKVASLAHVEAISKSLERHVRNNTAELNKLAATLEMKANVDEVPTIGQFEEHEHCDQKGSGFHVPAMTQYHDGAVTFPNGFVPGMELGMPVVYYMMPQSQISSNGSSYSNDMPTCS